ncbi:MAG: hypothetical protein HY955_03010 [Deltaproteobacteria bacterium]|nr:hypothetical protein [Deltaproteobacteria bacterium]
MKNQIRPVFIGVLLGIFSIIFGIFWAMYLATQHESIHRTLSMSARSSIEGKFVVSPKGNHADHAAGGHVQGGHDAVAGKMMNAEGDANTAHPAHSEDEMEEAHERLTRGHLHAMGLGLLTISVSVLLSFLSASQKMKTLAATCLGTGGFFYPFSWIIMGYRTPALGAQNAAESVVPIAGLSAILVLAGVFLTLFFLVRDFVKGRP